MPNEYKKRVNQSKQLIRLHEMRVRACEMHYREQQKKCHEAQEALDQRRATISKLKAQRTAVIEYLQSPEVIASPELVEMANQRRHWLEYDLEKDEYYLPMDEETLQEAQKDCAQARTEWLRARSRESSAVNLLKESQHKVRLALEQFQELENEESSTVVLRIL